MDRKTLNDPLDGARGIINALIVTAAIVPWIFVAIALWHLLAVMR